MRRRMFLVAVFLCFGFASMAAAGVVPVVKLNGGYDIVGRPGTPLTLTVSVTPNEMMDTQADWWLGAQTPDNKLYHFDLETASWVLDSETGDLNQLRVTYQGPLFDLVDMEIPLTGLDVSQGVSFGVAVDLNQNGCLDYDSLSLVSYAGFTAREDCRISYVQETFRGGPVGSYIIFADYSTDMPADGERFMVGNASPDGAWIRRPVDANGMVLVDYLRGSVLNASFGTTIDGVDHFIDPACSSYAVPVDGPPDQKHFAFTLGTKDICPATNTDDPLINGVYSSGTTRRVYIDFTKLPIMNYQQLVVFGQMSPNNAWVPFEVHDEFPCYWVEFEYPDGGLWEFTFYVIKQDGIQEWIDPTKSTQFQFLDHLAIQF